jgi:hypothetical protein
MLLGHVIMSMPTAPFTDSLEAAPKALLHRLDMNRELPLPASRTLIREAEEVEGCGLGPIPFGLLEGRAPEMHQARLLGDESS